MKGDELNRTCTLKKGKNSCGRKHLIFEFGGVPTQPAASYPAPLCQYLQHLFVSSTASQITSSEARSQVTLASSGVVSRHKCRGNTELGSREIKRQEDDKSLAGMRNPASVCREWPSLEQAMAPLRDIFLKCHASHPTFRGMAHACGASPSRASPSEEDVKLLRHSLGQALNLSPELLESHHPASPWKYAIAEDPDAHG